jgi:hypothetical protein
MAGVGGVAFVAALRLDGMPTRGPLRRVMLESAARMVFFARNNEDRHVRVRGDGMGNASGNR